MEKFDLASVEEYLSKDGILINIQPYHKSGKTSNDSLYNNKIANPLPFCQGAYGSVGPQTYGMFDKHYSRPLRKAETTFTGKSKYEARYEQTITINNKCEISLELLVMYFTFELTYKRRMVNINIDNDSLMIKHKRKRILISYNNQEWIMYIRGKHKTDPEKLLKYILKVIDSWRCDVRFSRMECKFFEYETLIIHSVYRRLIKGWKLLGDIEEKKMYYNQLTLPCYSNIKIWDHTVNTHKYYLVLANYVTSEEQWNEVLSNIRPINGYRYSFRPILNQIHCSNTIVIPFYIIHNGVLECPSIFNDDRSIKFDTLKIHGLYHVYEYVDRIFDNELYTDADKFQVAIDIGINETFDNFDQLKQLIIRRLDSIMP